VRTLAGWLLHPNVGACLVLQTEEDVAAAAAGHGLSYTALKGEVERSGRADQLASLPHAALSLRLRDFGAELDAAEARARALLPEVTSCVRRRCPVSALSVAQQCGGSDAFSGTSANPNPNPNPSPNPNPNPYLP